VIPPVLPRPPTPFPPVNANILSRGFVIHRNHSSIFRPAEFNPCRGAPARFSPVHDSAGNCVPTLYGATTREAAAFETIFHGKSARPGFNTVSRRDIEMRAVSQIASKRDLRLAPLFAPDLAAWGLQRTDIIDTPELTYGQTVRWAEAIHAADATLDGLVWTSRQCDPERCFVMFGDRMTEPDFEVLDRQDVAGDPDLMRELGLYGLRAGITIIN